MESKKPSSIPKSVKSAEKKNDIVKSSDSDSSISDSNVNLLSSSIQTINTIPQSPPPNSDFQRTIIEMFQSLKESIDINHKELIDTQIDFKTNVAILRERIVDVNNN